MDFKFPKKDTIITLSFMQAKKKILQNTIRVLKIKKFPVPLNEI
jgi:hypothetical protein